MANIRTPALNGLVALRRYALCLLLLMVAARALAAGVTLAWDPVASASGYMVYHGPAVGNYPTKIDVGNTTTYAVTSLAQGATYHFVVTAYDGSHVESGPSNDVVGTVPYNAPVAQFTASATTGVAPLALNFLNGSTGTITSYAWTFGDGTSSTLAAPVHVYAAAGVYTVVLTVTGPGGSNTQTRANYVTVTSPPLAPVAQFTGTPTSGVAPLTVNFSNTSTGSITSYAWTFGDGASSTSVSPSHLYAAPGVYTVALTVTGPAGSNTQTRTNYVTVAATSGLPAVTATGDTSTIATSSTLNGLVSSNGSVTTVTFLYGLTTAYGNSVAAVQSPLAAGAVNQATFANITGLSCGQTYHYRVVGTNSAGTKYSADSSFKTSKCTAGFTGRKPPRPKPLPIATSAS